MKKKGFTLIELLAVIIILAIIALIATPIIMNVIEKSRSGANLRGAENYIAAVETLVATEKLGGNVMEGTYEVMPDGNLCSGALSGSNCNGKVLNVDMSGTKPSAGTLIIENGIVTRVFNLKIGDSIISANADGELVEVGTTPYDKWDGVTATALADLEIDETKKIVSINSAADLAGLRNAVNNGNLKNYNIILNTNIDLNNQEWSQMGIGGYTSPGTHFQGTFDGNGYTITGLKISEGDEFKGVSGFIGYASGDTVVKNLNISGNVTGLKTAGAIIGAAYDVVEVDAEGNETVLYPSNITIENCNINVNVDSTDSNGGAVGITYNTGELIINNVENNGSMTAHLVKENRGKVGGLVGSFNGRYVQIYNSVNNGVIKGGAHQGGLVGYTSGNATIKNSVNNGNIYPGEEPYTYIDAGGILGYVQSGSTGEIADCINNGTVEGAVSTGGIVGFLTIGWELKNNQNTGNISGLRDAGGIIGIAYESFTATNNSNSADIYGVSNAGGVVGNFNVVTDLPEGVTTYNVAIKNCNGGTGSITTAANGYAGRIVGLQYIAARFNAITTVNLEGSTNNGEDDILAIGSIQSA